MSYAERRDRYTYVAEMAHRLTLWAILAYGPFQLHTYICLVSLHKTSVKTKKTKYFHVEFFHFPIGNFKSLFGKKDTFDIGNGALFRSQIKRKRNTAGVYLCFLFLLPNIECEYSLEPPRPQCIFFLTLFPLIHSHSMFCSSLRRF